MHRQHKPMRSKAEDRVWTHCITPTKCAAIPARQQAHGNIMVIDHCTCGATRASEHNGRHINFGLWVEGNASPTRAVSKGRRSPKQMRVVYYATRDEMKCTCGNTSHTDGFVAVDEFAHQPMEPIKGEGWEGRYMCQSCGATIKLTKHQHAPKTRTKPLSGR